MKKTQKVTLQLGVSMGTAVLIFLALFAALNPSVLAAPVSADENNVAPVTQSSPQAPLANDIRISQVYGGGGNSGSTYTNDFIELFNSGSTTVDLADWSVQYASSTGTSWQVTPLSGSINPGQYFLIQQAQGSGGTTPLPTPDVIGAIPMSGSNGKVALVSNITALTGACPTSVIDFVGYGSANCFEGTGATPALSNPTAAIRNDKG
ncbi:MAG: lamin tail domain-containing protein, partial [Anaerolineales bacterium]|nr:lamin tail domain-containing protein [Anaerolineales bacterium]